MSLNTALTLIFCTGQVAVVVVLVLRAWVDNRRRAARVARLRAF